MKYWVCKIEIILIQLPPTAIIKFSVCEFAGLTSSYEPSLSALRNTITHVVSSIEP